MGRKQVNSLLGLAAIITLSVSCQKSSDDTPSATTSKKLYVAAGFCNSGPGITSYTATTASRAVTMYSSTDGSSQGVFTDLNFGPNVSAGTVPQYMMDRGDHILMMTENAVTMGDRKIFKVFKDDPSIYVTYATDPTAFTNTAGHVLRGFTMEQDGSLIFSKSLFAERINSLGVRIGKGATGILPWVNPAAATGNCFTAAGALIGAVQLMTPFTGTNQGKLLYIHAGATAATNRIGAIQRTGLLTTIAADCAGTNPAGGLSAVAHTNASNFIGPVTFGAQGASPTAMAFIPTPAPATTTGKLLVTYSAATNAAVNLDNGTNFNHGVVMWNITETSATAVTIDTPVILWRDDSVVYAPSAITYDADTNEVYVASGPSPGLANQSTQNFGYNIEKFTLDLSNSLLTRVSENNLPFISGNVYTKCISHMILAD